MAKITREPQKIFGGSLPPSNNIAVFGSLKAGSPAYSGDPSTIQSAAYSLGWSDAVVANQAPALQDMNALFYNDSYQLSYLMQTGVPEWDAATIYYIGSKAMDGNGTIFQSVTDINVNNVLSDTTNWRVFASQRIASTSANLAVAYDTYMLVCTGSSALAITLPQAVSANTGRRIGVKSQVSGALVTLTPSGGSLIDGAASVVLSELSCITVVSSGSAWIVEELSVPTDYLESLGTSASLVTSQWSDGGSSPILVPPGTWDLQASGWFNPAVSTTFEFVEVGIGTVTGNSSTGVLVGQNVAAVPFPNLSAGGNWFILTTPSYRVTLSTATNYYAKVFAIFSASTCAGTGYLTARRVK